jgi:hypothetical protein
VKPALPPGFFLISQTEVVELIDQLLGHYVLVDIGDLLAQAADQLERFIRGLAKESCTTPMILGIASLLKTIPSQFDCARFGKQGYDYRFAKKPSRH